MAVSHCLYMSEITIYRETQLSKVEKHRSLGGIGIRNKIFSLMAEMTGGL